MVQKLWPGETAVILATGPSLTRADVDFVRGKAHVLCVNDSHRLAPWGDVLFSADRYWWPYYKGVPGFQGMKFGIGSVLGKADAFPGYPDITVLKNTGLLGIETDASGLRSGRNSGFSCLNLAVHFGVRRIILLGYDMSYDNGKAHFFGSHPRGLTQNEALYPGFRSAFESMVEPLKALSVEVVNCTRRTVLKTFPLMPLEEALPDGVVRVA